MIRRLAGCATVIKRTEQTLGTMRNTYQCQTVGNTWEDYHRQPFSMHHMDPQFKIMEEKPLNRKEDQLTYVLLGWSILFTLTILFRHKPN